jgi:tetratricopeptide (TPR) repeat protein
MPSRRNRLPWWTPAALLVPALALVPAAALAGSKGAGDEASASAGRGGPGRDYLRACAQGNAKYAARDFAGAIEQYQKAIELSPDQPLGHYLLGEAELASGSLTDADAAWTRAAQGSTGDAAMHARVLFVLADLKERERRPDDARFAWQSYLDWLEQHPSVPGFPATAQARVKVIDAAVKLDQACDPVRKRIAATKDGAVYSDPAKPSPAK